MMSSRGSCPLEQDLREIASREFDVLEGNNSSDEECRRSCAVVLTAIDGFLRKWSDVDVGRNNGNSISGSFPLPLLRELTSKIVREVGPGDTLFRTSWLRLLRRSTTKSVAVFNFVLEFLPCAFLRNQEEDNALKTELLSALDFVLETDSNSLSPVLECLQRIALPLRTEKKAVFRFIINHVSKAQEHSLGQVIKSLFDLATDEGDLSVAIQAMRERVGSETAALLVAQEIFGINEEVGQLKVFDEYLAIVEDECNPGGTEGILRCVDVLVLLLHRHIPKYGTAIENQFDRVIGNGNMNNRLLASIARLSSLYDPGAPLDRGNYTWIQCLDDHLIWLLIFICHGPIRSPKLVSSEKALYLAKDFGVDLLLLSGQGGKHLVITAVLQFAEELQATMKKASTNHSHTSTAQSYSPGLSGVEFSALLRIQSVLFMILDSVAEKIPDVLSLHMRAINRSLTNGYMDYAAVESTCSLMVRVSRHRRRGSATDDSNDSSNDPFFVARALIFSGKADDSYSLAISQEGSVESCVRGLILASKILLSCHQNPTEISLLWQSVKSVLLPPTNRLPHPRRGNHGIRALRFFFAWMQQTNDDSARLLKPGIFGTLTSILTTSRLVQYTNFLKKVSAPKSSVLCYTCRPHCFRDDGSNQRQFHKMIFSFDALQSDINFCHPPNWELSTRFVFELIDTYLGIGRTRSTGKWIAHAWVEASFDFPLMDIYHLRASNARQQRMVNLVEGISNDFDTSRDSMTTKGLSEKEFGDMLKQMKKSERTEILQSLLRSTMSFCLGLALSASILHNTFEQYAGVLDEQETTGFCHQRAEATRLMQYQLAKIYDIAAKCRSMETLFRGISNANLRTKSRRKKSNQGWKNIGMQFEKMELHADIRTASEKLKLILSSFTSSDEYVKSAVLWYCLVDPSHDSCLIKKIESEVMSSNAPSTEFEDHYDVILGFRLGILQHLTSHLQRFSGRSRSGSAMTPPHVLLKELARMQPFFAQCLRLATFLLSKLPEVLGADLDTIRAKRLALLTAAYFRLLLVSMEICLDIHRDGSLETNQHNTHLLGPGQFFVLYRSIMGAERPLTDAITMADDVVHNPVSFKSILQSFRRYLTKCRDTTVVTEMLETLSVLALHSNEDEAVIEMVRISWTAFHSKFLDDGATSGPVIPFALTEALNRFSPGAMLNSNPTTIKDAAIRETLLKSAFCNTKVQENQSFLVQGMLRHWGFLVLSEHLYQSSADHLHQLFASLQSFLGEAHESIGPKQRIQKDENRSGDDDEYLPPKRSRSIKPATVLAKPIIPGLNQWSYVAYFQTLLDITVSSCALFRIKDDGDWIDSMNGPYTPLSNLVETFGSLVDLFRQRMHIFPRQCFASVLNACRSMLNVALAQSTQCIEWRSSQPVLTVEKIEVKAFDPASVQNLGNVFDAFGIYVVGTLDALCGSIESMGISTADPANGIVPGLSQKQKVKALRLKVNKVCSYLQKSAAEHNLPTPRQSLQEVTNGQPTRKRRRIEIWGFHNFESSPEDSVDTKNIPGPSNFHANARKRALAQPSLTDEAISSELTWEEGSSEDDGSFGADGDWGRQSEEEDEIRINAGT